MVYQGSKNKLAKYIVPIIQNIIDENNITTYVEPFVGGANIIDKINCLYKTGSDNNKYVIKLLEYARDNPNIPIAPESCSFEHYKDVRDSYNKCDGRYSDEYISLIGYCASYGGRFFDGGYGRDSKGGRSIYTKRLKNLKSQSEDLSDINFRIKDYHEYKPDDYNNCLFYCDPPYRNTKQYAKQNINYDQFYDWCRNMSKNNIVIISEYNMPEDFECVWSKERKVMQKSDRVEADKATEKLFIKSRIL